jgi:hypothetical protein
MPVQPVWNQASQVFSSLLENHSWNQEDTTRLSFFRDKLASFATKPQINTYLHEVLDEQARDASKGPAK